MWQVEVDAVDILDHLLEEVISPFFRKSKNASPSFLRHNCNIAVSVYGSSFHEIEVTLVSFEKNLQIASKSKCHEGFAVPRKIKYGVQFSGFL